jgi:transketolase
MTVDIRDAFFQEIANYALNDPDFIIITNDMDAFALAEFKSKCPERFINSGVAEQNMVNIAAGLASAGKKVLIFGILSFISTRCLEQIKLNICGMNLPVIIVGIGPGLSFSFDGPTHHATNDITIMRQLPELRILNPNDENTASAAATIALDFSAPTYVRLDKGQFYYQGFDEKKINDGLVTIKSDYKKLILITGTVFKQLDDVLTKLNKHIDFYSIVNIVQIQPIPKSLIELLSVAEKVIIIEENSMSGGILNLISEIIVQQKFKTEVDYVTLQQKHFFSYGNRNWLIEKHKEESKNIFN